MAPPLVACLLALPLAALGLLIARPGLDGRWEHQPTHFWLVLTAGVACAALAYALGTAAARRSDARVFLLSLAFLAARRLPRPARPRDAGRAARREERRLRARDPGRPGGRRGARRRVRRRVPLDGPRGDRIAPAAGSCSGSGSCRLRRLGGSLSLGRVSAARADVTPPGSGPPALLAIASSASCCSRLAAVGYVRGLPPARGAAASAIALRSPARRGDGGGGGRPQLARQLVGVAPAHAERVRAGRVLRPPRVARGALRATSTWTAAPAPRARSACSSPTSRGSPPSRSGTSRARSRRC